jgi:hypothetical protein
LELRGHQDFEQECRSTNDATNSDRDDNPTDICNDDNPADVCNDDNPADIATHEHFSRHVRSGMGKMRRRRLPRPHVLRKGVLL